MNDAIDTVRLESMTPGEALAEARLAKNMSEADVAQQLLLGKLVVMALEKDDYSKIAAPVYARGYLKSYAQFLGLPVEVILASFERLNYYKDAQVFGDAEAKQSMEMATMHRLFPVKWVYYGVLAVVILSLISVMATHQFSTKTNEESVNKEGLVSLDLPAKTDQDVASASKKDLEKKTVDNQKVSIDSESEQSLAIPGQKETVSDDTTEQGVGDFQENAEKDTKKDKVKNKR